MDALETARQIFDLPALFSACFLAFYATAGTGALLGAQLIDVRGNGEIIEIRQMAPPTATLDPPQLCLSFRMWRKIVRVEGLALRPFTELQQHLCQIAAAKELVGTRSVVPLLVALQL